MITAGQLCQIMPTLSEAKAEAYIEPLTAAMAEGHLDGTLDRAAMFLAQVGHESEDLRYWEEIASGQAYEGRADLGNVEPGDGRRFKGRGPIQLTGRANYAKYGKLLGVDLVADPALAATPAVGFRVAVLFWTLTHCTPLADLGDVEAVTRIINGGLNGLADRQQRFARALRALGAGK